jgi:hypothetical protein
MQDADYLRPGELGDRKSWCYDAVKAMLLPTDCFNKPSQRSGHLRIDTARPKRVDVDEEAHIS